MDRPIRVLLIEDEPGDVHLIGEMLAKVAAPGLALDHAESLGAALDYLKGNDYDVILSDLGLPDAHGLEAVIQIQSQFPPVPIVVLTSLDSQDVAIRAIGRGAQDYLAKGQFDGNVLWQAIRYAMERKRVQERLKKGHEGLQREVEELKAQLQLATEALQAEIAKRRGAEQSLRDLNEHVEQRVLPRTAELTSMNTQLLRELGERKRSEAQTLKRNRQLLSVQAAIAATVASLDRAFVLETVTWEMTNLLEVDGCTISEWDREADTLSVIAEYPAAIQALAPLEVKAHRLADHSPRKRALIERSAQQVTIDHAGIDPAELSRLQEGDLRTLLLIPMVFHDRVMGLVEMRTSQVERTFTDHEISLAHLLANQAASAIENANLYERAQQEIGRRMEAEERMKASLKEKEVLLKEIHHRVKNNLQVVSSLLYLQSETINDPDMLGLLQDSQNRVRSMALVHERLYQAEDLSRIDFPEYVRELASHLIKSYSVDISAISLSIDAGDIALDVDTAVPCGLIVNELISNSLKHAFPADPVRETDRLDPARHQAGGTAWDTRGVQRGAIHIELRSGDNGQMQLVVGDNGVGFPEDMDFRNTESLGLLLVNSLVRQLKGTIELHRDAGTAFKISFGTAGHGSRDSLRTASMPR